MPEITMGKYESPPIMVFRLVRGHTEGAGLLSLVERNLDFRCTASRRLAVVGRELASPDSIKIRKIDWPDSFRDRVNQELARRQGKSTPAASPSPCLFHEQCARTRGPGAKTDFYLAACAAFDGLHHLHVKLHYASCAAGVWRGLWREDRLRIVADDEEQDDLQHLP